jgi:predicted nucleotidyltransferase
VREYVQTVRGAGLEVADAYLFGSFAGGAPHSGSDIDVAIASPSLTGNSMDDQIALMRLAWDIDVRIEPHAFRPEDFTPDNPWVAEILRTGIKIV